MEHEKKNCLHCSKVFVPERKTKKFCSDNCRIMHFKSAQLSGLKSDKERLTLRLKKIASLAVQLLKNPNLSEVERKNIHTEILKIKKEFPLPESHPLFGKEGH